MQYDGKDTIYGVYVTPGSAETLVRRGGIANHRLIAYSLSNISVIISLHYCVEVIVCYISVVSLKQCSYSLQLHTFRSKMINTTQLSADSVMNTYMRENCLATGALPWIPWGAYSAPLTL